MTPEGLERLKLDEGCKLTAYPDPVSGGEPWTCGYGHTGPDVKHDTVWTQDQADVALAQDVAEVESQLTSRLRWFASLDPVRQDTLTNVAFNIGVSGLMKWPTTLSHYEAHNWQAAHDDLLSEGRWNAQVGQRANRLASAALTGSWA